MTSAKAAHTNTRRDRQYKILVVLNLGTKPFTQVKVSREPLPSERPQDSQGPAPFMQQLSCGFRKRGYPLSVSAKTLNNVPRKRE